MEQNAAAGEFHGPVVQAGSVHGGVYVHSGTPVVTGYRSQVERIAPKELNDRDRELDELAEFCVHGATSYLWLRARAWSGKSALLSTFVLNPPSGVRVVSFFVTASFGPHSDRRAFVDNVLEQLWAMMEVPPASHLTEFTRDTHLLALLTEAARQCEVRGERLVLVVDGLDEDRGRESRSIAALLPEQPRHGMRVIVSSRPNPPLPKDVAERHPLRAPEIIRPLQPSAKAEAVRVVMEGDLQHLMRGSRVEQDLLGLLTAAGGGLSTPDLAELIGVSEWAIDNHLGTSAGRSFTRRGSVSSGGHDVYLLAHERLQTTARSMLGPKLEEYRSRLHEWAARYARQQWPENTPDYLFRGYFAMLSEAGLTERMIACATDPGRHRRMLARTGGDGASLAEIIATQDCLLAAENPDLIALTRLAVHRSHLHRGSSRIPHTIPAGWIRVGQYERALAMIEAIPDPARRIDAVLAAHRVCRAGGQPDRAAHLLDRAERIAGGLNQYFSARPIRALAEACAMAGDFDRARRTVDLVESRTEKAQALAALAAQAAESEEHELARSLFGLAEEMLVSDTNDWRYEALSAAAVAALKVGERVRSEELLDEAENLLRKHRGFGTNTNRFGNVVRDMVTLGHRDRAVQLIQSIRDEDAREAWVEWLITEVAREEGERGVALARDTPDDLRLCRRLAAVSQVLPDHDRASRLLAEAEGVAERLSSRNPEALLAIAAAKAVRGDLARAEELVRVCAPATADAESVLEVAAAALRAEDFERGTRLLVLAETVARSSVPPRDERQSLHWVRTVADMGDFERAEKLVRSFQDGAARSAGWALIAEAALVNDDLELAEHALGLVEYSSMQRRARLDLIRAHLAAGVVTHATVLARRADDLSQRIDALLVVAREGRSSELIEEIVREIASLGQPARRMKQMARLLGVTAELRDRERVRALSEEIRCIAAAVVADPGSERFAKSRAEPFLALLIYVWVRSGSSGR
ncbi:hypothetical protein L1857_29405 [Amycolatopsis thermalba]|uniref:Nephrocystin 3-like N-terminal domain-containing protein n=1 Tax=Amycolatopsis thermalba TaxID=944492 RepID=A0ABY4P2U4_9PSEU|nr:MULTISPECIES: hypothetical protein [Amycolatopsis]UQS26629.1 hypothetical protein L1857_29405 [Amycolatopsis thermalba]